MPDPDEQGKPPSVIHTRQVLFVRCLGKLIQYATERGYELTLGEGRVTSPRLCRDGVAREDGIHMPDSLHYHGLAQDLNLFVREDGEWRYITRSNHFAWVDLGAYWESLDPLCRWGGRFADGNHVSVTYQGRA